MSPKVRKNTTKFKNKKEEIWKEGAKKKHYNNIIV